MPLQKSVFNTLIKKNALNLASSSILKDHGTFSKLCASLAKCGPIDRVQVFFSSYSEIHPSLFNWLGDPELCRI